jgi:hypothetical protein
MANEQVKLAAAIPDAHSLSDFERLPDGPDLHAHFVAAAAKGDAQFLAVMCDDKRAGTAVFTYLEHEGALVCNALSCEALEGVNIAGQVADAAESWGLRLGAKILRFWTARDGLIRLMESQGYQIKHVGEKVIG